MAITNVGIKDEQKAEIEALVRETGGKYSSVNEFVQLATQELIFKEKTARNPKEVSSIKGAVPIVEKFIERLLEDNLEDKIILIPAAMSAIKKILNTTQEFRVIFPLLSRADQLRSAIEVKNSLDSLKQIFSVAGHEVPQKYISELESIEKDFVKAIKST